MTAPKTRRSNQSTMAAAQRLSPRPKMNAREAVMASPDANESPPSRHGGIRPIEGGLSFSYIAIGRCVLRLRANPTKALLPAIVLFVVLVIVFHNSKHFHIVHQSHYQAMREQQQGGAPFVQRPLMVQLLNSTVSRLIPQKEYQSFDRQNSYWLDHGTSFMKPRSRVKEGCTPLADWQEGFHPNCNAFHEVSLTQLNEPIFGYELIRLVNNGAYRDVWGIRDYDGARRVLKTLRYIDSRKFDQRNFDRHRRDAVASEQLSASPYIVDIYGYCSNSALADYCDGGDLFDVHEVLDPSKDELLEIAYDLAAALADAHHYDKRGRATIAHTDIKPNQFIHLNGKYRLNDFNRCRFMTWDNDRDEPCGFVVARNAGAWRAPEEYSYKKETEKLDVFSLGNVLYFLLTKRAPLDDMDSDEGMEFIANGGRVEVTEEKILQSTHPFDRTMLKAMDMCFVSDPKERATSKQVRDFIKIALDKNKRAKQREQ